MIEEAAGTMMYESKKQQAQKTIEKKESKLKEINNVSSFCVCVCFSSQKISRLSFLRADQPLSDPDFSDVP